MIAGVLWRYFCQRTPVLTCINEMTNHLLPQQSNTPRLYLRMNWQIARQFMCEHIADVPGEHRHGIPGIVRDQVWAPTSCSITGDYQRSPNQSVSCLIHVSHIQWFIPSIKYRVCWVPHVYVYVVMKGVCLLSFLSLFIIGELDDLNVRR